MKRFDGTIEELMNDDDFIISIEKTRHADFAIYPAGAATSVPSG